MLIINIKKQGTKRKKIILSCIALCIHFVCISQYNRDIVVDPILKTDTTSIGQLIKYPDLAEGEFSMVKVTIPPGKSTGWHKHTFPVFAYVLKGLLSIEQENGKTMLFKTNTSFAEMIDTFHNGSNKGKKDVVLIVLYMGEKGKPLSVKK